MTTRIDMNDWNHTYEAEWDYIKRYPANVQARKGDDRYGLHLDGDTICSWMEATEDELINDGKLTKDTTDEEISKMTEKLCVDYINDDLAAAEEFGGENEDLLDLPPRHIADLYQTMNLDILISNWITTTRDNMKEEEK